MAISGDLRIAATLASYHQLPPRSSLSLPSSKVEFAGLNHGGPVVGASKFHGMVINNQNIHGPTRISAGVLGDYRLSQNPIGQDVESFLLNVINMSFFERLGLAWKIIFPSSATRRSSNASIAKQRLKMILFSDRCAVSDEAKQKIVENIVRALSDFVEIESHDKVQLSVSTDTDLGTIYSVSVPVRGVKPEFLEEDEAGKIMNVEYKDYGTESGSVDVRFDFFVPDE